MSYLLYSSDEMYSSTQLIRQSKSIFDKVSKKEIDKAIILRDGKPTFILFDFGEYEKIMKEYTQLKTDINTYSCTNSNIIQNETQTTVQTDDSIITDEIKIDKKEKSKPDQLLSDKVDDFVVELDNDSIDMANGEIKEFWNE